MVLQFFQENIETDDAQSKPPPAPPVKQLVNSIVGGGIGGMNNIAGAALIGGLRA